MTNKEAIAIIKHFKGDLQPVLHEAFDKAISALEKQSEPNLSGQDAYSQILVLRLRFEMFVEELSDGALNRQPMTVMLALREFLNELNEAERKLMPK
jgi:hypothetical protein